MEIKERNNSKTKGYSAQELIDMVFQKNAEKFKQIRISKKFGKGINFVADPDVTSLHNLPFSFMAIQTDFELLYGGKMKNNRKVYISFMDTSNIIKFPIEEMKKNDGVVFIIGFPQRKNESNLLISFFLNLEQQTVTPLGDPPPTNETYIDPVLCIVTEVVDYINSPKTTVNKEKPRPFNILAKPQKRSNDVIYINKREYTYDEENDNEKREYERHVKECSVRGHWRRYRNEKGEVAKKIWIEPHKRTFDDGAEENNKVYKI
jgi:hypothetical protein